MRTRTGKRQKLNIWEYVTCDKCVVCPCITNSTQQDLALSVSIYSMTLIACTLYTIWRGRVSPKRSYSLPVTKLNTPLAFAINDVLICRQEGHNFVIWICCRSIPFLLYDEVRKIGGTKLWKFSSELDPELTLHNKKHQTKRLLVPAMEV